MGYLGNAPRGAHERISRVKLSDMKFTKEDETFFEELKREADKWAASPEGRRIRKEAEEAYTKSGDIGDFVAIMLGATRIRRRN